MTRRVGRPFTSVVGGSLAHILSCHAGLHRGQAGLATGYEQAKSSSSMYPSPT
jgi:hypothetical protein